MKVFLIIVIGLQTTSASFSASRGIGFHTEKIEFSTINQCEMEAERLLRNVRAPKAGIAAPKDRNLLSIGKPKFYQAHCILVD